MKNPTLRKSIAVMYVLRIFFKKRDVKNAQDIHEYMHIYIHTCTCDQVLNPPFFKKERVQNLVENQEVQGRFIFWEVSVLEGSIFEAFYICLRILKSGRNIELMGGGVLTGRENANAFFLWIFFVDFFDIVKNCFFMIFLCFFVSGNFWIFIGKNLTMKDSCSHFPIRPIFFSFFVIFAHFGQNAHF